MSRHRMLNRVKIQLAGQQRYAEPDDVLAVERELLLHAQTNGWRFSLRKSRVSDELKTSAAKLLRSDGSPRGITLIDKRELGKSPILVARFGQRTEREIRWSRAVQAGGMLKVEFDGMVIEAKKLLSLSEAQTAVLMGAWPAFLARYQSKIREIWG